MILVLGVRACAAGARRATSTLFSVLGGTAFVLGVLAIITGSLTPLSLLVADMVVMWAIATGRHAHAPPGAANRHMTRRRRKPATARLASRQDEHIAVDATR